MRARPRRIVAVCAGGAVALALAGLVSETRPFTAPADALTAIPLAAMAAVQALLWIGPLRERRSGAIADVPDIEARASRSASRSRFPLQRFSGWLTLFALVLTFELLTYFEQPRQRNPTLSSLSDELSRWHVGKVALFLGWLALGWLLSRRVPDPVAIEP